MDIDSRLAVAENRIEYYETFMNKIELAIDKMSEASSHISKMLAVHEQRLDMALKTDDMILSTMESHKEDIHLKLETIKLHYQDKEKIINEKIEKIENSINELQKLKWVVNGIGITLSITVVAVSGLFQGFLTPANMPSILRLEHQAQEK